MKGRDSHITVLMTTHQSMRFLSHQLASILSQDRLPDLLVVADDASSDGTLDLLREMEQHSAIPMAVISHSEHVGLRRNIEDGLQACPSGIIVLADHDDIWSPHKLTTAAEALAEMDVAVWFSDAELIDEQDRLLGRTAWEAVHLDPGAQRAMLAGSGVDRLLHGMTVVGATMAFTTGLLNWALPLPPELEGENYLYLHDGWLSVLASVVGEVATTPERLVRYRQHPGQVTAMSLLGAARASSNSPTGSVGDDLVRERDRLALVCGRVRRVGAPSANSARILQTLEARLAFVADRVTIRDGAGSPARRGGLVLRHVLRGDYHRFARGALSVAKDLRLMASP